MYRTPGRTTGNVGLAFREPTDMRPFRTLASRGQRERLYSRGAGEIGMCEDPEFACDVEMRDELKPRIGIAEIAGQDRSPDAGCGKLAGGDEAIAARGKSRRYVCRQPTGNCARRRTVVEPDPRSTAKQKLLNRVPGC